METQVSGWIRRIAMILISLEFSGLCPSARANPFLSPLENHTGSRQGFVLEPRAGYFTTSNNYDSSGALSPIPNGNSASRLLIDLHANYGLSDDLFLYGRLSLLSNRVSIGGQSDQSAFGLSDQQLGAALRVFSSTGGTNLSIQAEATIPAYSNSSSKTNGTPYMGDGSTDLTGAAFLELPFGSAGDWYLEGGAGFTWRSNGFSAAVPYAFILRRDPGQSGVVLEGGVHGQFSLKTDKATQDSTLAASTASEQLLGSGGSNLLYAINPSWISVGGKIGYKNDSGHTVWAGILAPVSGQNSPSGFVATLGVALDFGGRSEAIRPTRRSGTERSQTPRPPKGRKEFSAYDLSSKVTSFNDQVYLVKIDKGSMDGVDKGQIFDIFKKEIPIARAQVTHVKDDEAALSVLEYFQDQWIENGFEARRLVR